GVPRQHAQVELLAWRDLVIVDEGIEHDAALRERQRILAGVVLRLAGGNAVEDPGIGTIWHARSAGLECDPHLTGTRVLELAHVLRAVLRPRAHRKLVQ